MSSVVRLAFVLLAFGMLGFAPGTATARQGMVCANLFRMNPQVLHPVIYSRAREDERLGVRRFDSLKQLAHRVTAEGGFLVYKGHLLDTSKGTADGVHRRGIQIFALDSNMNLITTEHAPVGVIHHSTLTGGQPGYFFGEWRVRQGKVVMVSNMSGHTQPSVEQLRVFVEHLRELDVLDPNFDLVEIYPEIGPD